VELVVEVMVQEQLQIIQIMVSQVLLILGEVEVVLVQQMVQQLVLEVLVGKGVVILSVPTSSYSSTSTGSPTVTTSGSNTILQFNGSGSYTV
jgi:hypothetical protein